MKSIKEEFGTLKKLILFVLENYPETRNSDNKLFIQCARELGVTSLDELENGSSINLISLHKIRQHIQNKEGLFKPDNKIQVKRFERSQEIRDYMKAN